LHTEHAHSVLGELYLPEAVLVETLDGRFQAAMTYICWTMTPRPPENDDVQRILTAAQDLKLPSWYLDWIAGFLKSEPAWFFADARYGQPFGTRL
jgi:hypothetical protein